MQLGYRLGGAVVALMLLSATGCGRSFDAYCDDRIDCLDGNTEDTNACIRGEEATEDQAALFGCQEEYDAYQDCIEDEATCENDTFFVPDNECQDEAREYNRCIGS